MVVPADVVQAACAGNFDVVQAYFASGPRDIEDHCDIPGEPPLGTIPGMTVPVSLLSVALTPLTVVPGQFPPERPDEDGRCRIVEMLLRRGADPNRRIAGVRREGSWKAYCRVEHKRLLRLRSYLVRGYAETTDARVDRILRLPNGACWTVLAYWREAA